MLAVKFHIDWTRNTNDYWVILFAYFGKENGTEHWVCDAHACTLWVEWSMNSC